MQQLIFHILIGSSMFRRRATPPIKSPTALRTVALCWIYILSVGVVDRGARGLTLNLSGHPKARESLRILLLVCLLPLLIFNSANLLVPKQIENRHVLCFSETMRFESALPSPEGVSLRPRELALPLKRAPGHIHAQ